MNITEQEFKRYLEVFHTTLEQSAKEFLPQDRRKEIVYLANLPAKIIGYVSTQFGVGFEYIPNESIEIEIIKGSARVEDLLLNAPRRIREKTPIFKIDGHLRLLGGANINDSFPFRLTGENSTILVVNLKFTYDRYCRLVKFAELYSDRNIANWTVDKGIARAKDIILSALVDINQAAIKKIPIDEYIANYKQNTILLLGDYDTEGSKRLQDIKDSLIMLGYEPLLVKDIPDHPHHDLPQKVVAIGSISRFIVIDDSSKSGHLMEVGICKNNNWVTIVLRSQGKGGSFMTAGLSHYSKVILEKPYDSESLDKTIKESTQWAEGKLKELEYSLAEAYPWRIRK